jgi:transcription-repair coupling factor (superfamily II helicase)
MIYVGNINEYLTNLVLQFVQKHSNICKMKEKQTPNGLRLLLTFENVKSIRKALELMEMVG